LETYDEICGSLDVLANVHIPFLAHLDVTGLVGLYKRLASARPQVP